MRKALLRMLAVVSLFAVLFSTVANETKPVYTGKTNSNPKAIGDATLHKKSAGKVLLTKNKKALPVINAVTCGTQTIKIRYTGNHLETFQLPGNLEGTVKIKALGAWGGNAVWFEDAPNIQGGNGALLEATFDADDLKGKTLYMTVGQRGGDEIPGNFYYAAGGGGGTFISIGGNISTNALSSDLDNLLMAVGGGGGGGADGVIYSTSPTNTHDPDANPVTAESNWATLGFYGADNGGGGPHVDAGNGGGGGSYSGGGAGFFTVGEASGSVVWNGISPTITGGAYGGQGAAANGGWGGGGASNGGGGGGGGYSGGAGGGDYGYGGGGGSYLKSTATLVAGRKGTQSDNEENGNGYILITYTTPCDDVVPATALNFDGINDYLSVNNLTTGNLGSGDFTIETKFRTDRDKTYLFSKREGSCGGSDPFLDVAIWNNKISLELAGGDYVNLVSNVTVTDNAWHHFALVRKSGVASLYIDGVFQSSGASNANIVNNHPLNIGYGSCVGSNGSSYYKGDMDEIRFWNRALCEAEINNNINCELSNPASQTSLVAYYKLNQGNINADNSGINYATNSASSGSINDGTLNNFALNGATSNWAAGTVTGTCSIFSDAVASITGNTTICVGATAQLSNVTPGGVWSTTNETIASVNGSGLVTGHAEGTATISYTSACGTAAITTVTVNALNTIATGVNQASCINSVISPITLATTGATGATVSGLPAGVTGSWSGNTVTISGTPTVAGTFNYTVTTIGGNCTQATATGTITVNDLNTIAAGINRATCINSAITDITLATTGATGASFSGLPAGVTGSWSGNTVTISGTPTVAGTFNYTVTTTGGNCTQATATGSITVNALTTPTFAQVPAICSGESLTALLTTSTNYITGTWYPGLNNTATTTYTFTPDAEQCAATTTMTVVVHSNPATPTISGNVPFCEGQSITLSSSPAVEYHWSNGPLTQTNIINSPGTYSVTIKDANGCAATGSVIAVMNQVPQAVITPADGIVLCLNKISLPLNATSGAGYTYKWYKDGNLITGETGATYNATAAGSYTVTITSPQGCYSTSIPVTIHTANGPTIPAGPYVFCQGNTVNLSFTAPDATYQWQKDGFDIEGATNGTYAAGATGYYSVIVTIDGCATSSNSVPVTVNPLPATPTISGAGAICQGGSATLTASAASGYQWSNGPLSQTNVVNGAGTFTVTVTDANGCKSTSAPFTVVVNPNPAKFTVGGGGAYCAGGTGVNVTLSGSETGINYSLVLSGSPVVTIAGTGSAISFNNITPTGTYFITANNPTTGCGGTVLMNGSVNISATTVPVINSVTGTSSVCTGSGATIQAFVNTPSPQTIFTWYDAETGGNVLGTGFTLNITSLTATTTYYVEAAYNGCVSATRGSRTVTVKPRPTISGISGNLTTCEGVNNTLVASSSAVSPTFAWYANAMTMTPTFVGASYNTASLASSTTLYVAVISDGCLSVSRTPVTITVNPKPPVLQYAMTPNCDGSITVSAANATGSVIWSPGNISGTSITVAQSGIYSAIQTVNGCTSPVAPLTVTTLQPATVFSASGGGAVCAGGPGTTIYLSGSEAGVLYTLLHNGNEFVSQNGTGSAISFTDITAPGNYTIIAQKDGFAPECKVNMTGSVSVTQNTAGSVSANFVAMMQALDPGTCTATMGAELDPFVITPGTPASTVTYTYTGATTGSGSGTGFPGTFNKGTTYITVTVTNVCGSSSATVSLTTQDLEAPAVPALPDITAACSVTVITPVAADNCSGIVTVTTNDPLTYTAQGTYVIHWTFTDEAGNVSEGEQRVIVKDIIPPVPHCPSTITVTADIADNGNGIAGAIVNYAAAVTDNCNATLSYSIAPGSFFAIGDHEVTVTAVDEAGNTATCTFHVIVNCVTPTIANCPSDIEENATTGLCSKVVNYNSSFNPGFPVSSVSYVFSGATNGYGPGTGSGSAFNVGETTVTITASNSCGSVSCSFKVVIKDVEKPTITAPGNITVSADANCEAAVNLGLPTTWDNCGVLTVTNDAPAVFPKGTTTVTWTVTDIHNNTNTAIQTVTVTDNTKPTISCPADITRTANTVVNDIAGRYITYTATATDNCGTPSISYSPVSGSFFAIGTHAILVTSVDDAGNVATCTFNVTVNPKPIDAVDDDYRSTPINGAHGGTTPVILVNDLLDNAPVNISQVNIALTMNGGIAGVTLNPDGTITIPAGTWEGDYMLGYSICEKDNPSNCDEAIVWIRVARGLAVTTTAYCNNDVPYLHYKIVPNFIPDANPVTITWYNGDMSPVAAQTIATGMPLEGDILWPGAVLDNLGQPIDWPGWYISNGVWVQGADGFEGTRPYAYVQLSINPTEIVQVSYPPATPGCSVQPFNRPPVATPDTKTIEKCGTATINVVANDTDFENGPLTVTSISAPAHGTVVNNGDGTITYIPVTGFVGTDAFSYTITDAAGNTASTTVTITVEDTIAPVAPVLTAINGECDATVPVPVTTDGCSGTITGTTNDPVSYTAQGTYTITWAFTDGSNNTSYATQTVVVKDVTRPNINCPGDITLTANTVVGTASGAFASYTATATDNCGTADITYSIAPGSFFEIGTTQVVVTAKDAVGNTVTCTFNVIVNCVTPTIVSCPSDIQENATTGLCSRVVNYNSSFNLGFPAASVSYVFSGATSGYGPGTGSGSAFNVGETTVTVTASNSCGTVSCSFKVVINDVQRPTITAPGNITVNADANCEAAVSLGLPTTWDNCGVLTVTNDAPAVFPKGTTTVTWTVTDIHNNTNTATQIVTVTDNTRPTIHCPQDVVLSANTTISGNAGSYATYTATAADNCGVTELTYSIAPGSFFQIGTTPVTVTAKDAAGNTITCTFSVVVKCVTPAIMSCPSDIEEPATAGSCSTVVGYASGFSLGFPAASVSYTFSGATTGYGTGTGSGSSFNVGETIVTITVSNSCGTVSCSFKITVTDVEKPTITAPGNITADADANCTATVNLGLPATGDNCGVLTVTNDAPAVFPKGTTTVTWTVTDIHNNTNTAIQTVTVADNTKPTINCPENVILTANTTVGNAAGSFATYTATATDNCGAVDISYSIAPGSFFQIGTTPVTVTAMDAAGNTITCTFNVVVNCVPPAVISCSSDKTVSTDAAKCSAVVNYTASFNLGLPTGTVSYTFTGATNASGTGTGSGAAFNTGVTTVTVTATNICGSVSRSFKITVQDKEKPTITAPAAITVNADANCQATGVALGTPATGDNCGVLTVTSNAPAAFPVGNTTVTWTVTDVNNNTNTATQVVTVTDNTKPAVNCPGDITLTANTVVSGDAGAFASYTATATDNCGVTGISYSITPGSFFPIGTTPVTVTATDAKGNTSTCTFNVTVNCVKPVFTSCPSALTANTVAAGCYAPVSYTVAFNAGLPAGTLSYVLSGATSGSGSGSGSGLSFNKGVTTVTVTATNSCGSVSKNFTVTVSDKTAPAIICPANTAVYCGGSTLPAATGTATATDNCGTVSVSYTDAVNGNTITRTWTATDAAGNTKSCTQTITTGGVFTATVASIPTSNTYTGGVSTNLFIGYGAQSTKLQVSVPATGGPYTYAWSGSATGMLNSTTSNAPVFTPTAGNSYTFTVVVTNAYGCTSTAAITICVTDIRVMSSNDEDEDDDQYNCDHRGHDYSDCSHRGHGHSCNHRSHSKYDCNHRHDGDDDDDRNCDHKAHNSSDCSHRGHNHNSCSHRSHNSKDCEHNKKSYGSSQKMCDHKSHSSRDCGHNSHRHNSCDHKSHSSNSCKHNSGNNNNEQKVYLCHKSSSGATTTMIVAVGSVADHLEDHPGDRLGSCSQAPCTPFVDTEKPEIECPPAITVHYGTSTAPSSTGSATASDNSNTVTITYTDASTKGTNANSAGFYNYAITRTWKAMDAAGNFETCTQVITVKDVTKPVIACPANTTVTCGDLASPSATGTATATDNSNGPIAVTYSDYKSGTTITRTWKATDVSGNSATCTQTISVVDNIKPVISVPANTTVSCGASTAPNYCGNGAYATATDNCDNSVSISYSDVKAGNVITRTWKATDDAGNFITGAQTITIIDNVKPVITCPGNITVSCGSNTTPRGCNSEATARDNCDTDVDITYEDVTVGNLITRTWTATDDAGNTSTCVQKITIVDNVKPVLTEPNDITISCGTSIDPAVTGKATATDNCSTPAITYTDITSGNKITRTWKATDAAGNYVTDVQVITIYDNVKPVLTEPNDITVNCGTSIAPSVTGTATATDNCSGVTVTYSDVTSGNKITRTWKATDATGNYVTDVQVITIVDNVNPTVNAPANTTISCGASTLPASCGGSATGSDNCSGVAISYTDKKIGNVITRTWKATDASGNFSTDVQTITIVDNTKPVISCPGNITVSCGSNTTPSGCNSQATATDNCDNDVDISYSDVTSGNIITRTWKAMDDAGNYSTCVQKITIVDNVKPVLTEPNDITISCGTSIDPAVTGRATATDNCSTPAITYTDVTSGNKITRTWKATDAAGNYITDVQYITITDNTKPVISDVPDVTLNCGGSTSPSATGTATATDNCSTPTVTYSDATSGNVITRTWKATDAAGNSNTSTQVITVGSSFNPNITSVPTNSTYTGGVSTNLYLGYGAQSTKLEVCALPSSGAPYTYTWTGTATNRLNSTTSAAPTFTPTTFGSYTFTVTVKNKYGCTYTDVISICVTDIRVPGTSGSKVYVCNTVRNKWGQVSYQTLQVALNQVSSYINNNNCDNGDARLGSCDQVPCNYTSVASSSGTKQTTTSENVSVKAATTEEDLKVTVMPNPSTTFFTLKLESRYETPVNLRVMDGNGRVVDAKSKLGANSTFQIGHSYTSGTYYAEFIQGGARKVVQLIKARG